MLNLNDLEPVKFLNACEPLPLHRYKWIPSEKLQMPRQLQIYEPESSGNFLLGI